ncbi:MAG: hypothetical protein ACR2OE_12040 [Thermomicrobiales bacterium]
MTTYQERAAHAAGLLQKHYTASQPQKHDEFAALLRLRREHPEQFDRLGPIARMTVGFHDRAQAQEDDDHDDAA